MRAALAAAHKDDFRVVHLSVQSNHLHLLVEARDQAALSRGLQGLTVRLPRGIDRALASAGAVFTDRYHAHELTTPRETRAALLYVLQNWVKHGSRGRFDPRSSAAWFDGWAETPSSTGPPLVARPRTWPVSMGWRRHGLLQPGERPRRRREVRLTRTGPGVA